MVRRIIKAAIDTLLLMFGITSIWQWLELSIEGAIQPRRVDDIMLIIFSLIFFILKLQLYKHSD